MERIQGERSGKLVSLGVAAIALTWIAIEYGRLTTVGWMIGFPFPILLPPVVAILACVSAGHWRRRWAWASGLAIALMLLALPTFLSAVPRRINAQIAAQDRAALAGDLRQAAPVQLLGVVATIYAVRPSPDAPERISSRGCDSLCRTLLYSGTATGVVAMSPSKPGGPHVPTVWRMVRAAGVCAPLRNFGQNTVWQDEPQDGRSSEQELLGRCLVGSPARFADADFTIRHDAIGLRSSDEWLTLHPPQAGDRTSLWMRDRTGRQVLVGRRTTLVRRQLADPLQLATGGTPATGWHRYWQRSPLQSREDRVALGEFVRMKDVRVPPASTAELKTSFDRALRNVRSANDRFFEIASVALEQEHREPGDLERYLRLIRGPGTVDWPVTDAMNAFPERAGIIRDTVIDRIHRDGERTPEVRGFASRLVRLPAGSFATPSPLLLAMLRDPQKRRWFATIVPRLADGGPKAAPLLLDILTRSAAAAQWDSRDQEADLVSFDAAFEGLCVLGPSIAPTYRRIDQVLAAHPTVNARLSNDGVRWAVLQARTGKPFAAISSKPTNPQVWWINLRQRFANGDCRTFD